MTYKFVSPIGQMSQKCKAITLSPPSDTPLLHSKGQCGRHNGQATCALDELNEAAMLRQERLRLEARLQKSLDTMAVVTDNAEAERLLAHWDALNAAYNRVMAKIRDLGLEADGGDDGD
jgi:hypothetical protein